MVCFHLANLKKDWKDQTSLCTRTKLKNIEIEKYLALRKAKSKHTSHTKQQENIHNKKNQWIKTNPEMTCMIELLDKNIKIVIFFVFL